MAISPSSWRLYISFSSSSSCFSLSAAGSGDVSIRAKLSPDTKGNNSRCFNAATKVFFWNSGTRTELTVCGRSIRFRKLEGPNWSTCIRRGPQKSYFLVVWKIFRKDNYPKCAFATFPATGKALAGPKKRPRRSHVARGPYVVQAWFMVNAIFPRTDLQITLLGFAVTY